MDSTVSPTPLFKAGWLRALLYTLVLIILSGLTLASFILGLHSGTPDISGLTELLKGAQAAIITLIFFLLSLLITYVFRRWVDRRSFISIGLEIPGHFRDGITGAALAVFIMGSSCLLIQATGHLKWMDFIFDLRFLFIALGTIGLSAFSQELIFRGYILSNLLESFPKWLALGITTLLFMILHWTSAGFFPLLNTMLLGLITGLFYLYTRNLWFSVFFHWTWKFMAGPVLGFGDEGSTPSLLQSALQGDENITGGLTGIQGSSILTAIALLSAVALFLMLQKRLNPKSQPVPGRI